MTKIQNLEDIPMELLELNYDELNTIAGGVAFAVAGATISKLYLRPATLMERIACAEAGHDC